jgi:hypothetical protein
VWNLQALLPDSKLVVVYISIGFIKAAGIVHKKLEKNTVFVVQLLLDLDPKKSRQHTN